MSPGTGSVSSSTLIDWPKIEGSAKAEADSRETRARENFMVAD